MSSRTLQVVTIALSIGLLIGVGFLTGRIQTERELVGLGPVRELDAEPPPGMTLIVSMTGPLRGLAADMLWYRLEDLKQQGKYHEANTLGEWITTLQPRFPKVWSFLAWNMAYNISVKTNTPEERWEWVNKGVNLLREKGIPLNPKSVSLYRELSWIFSHKMGQFADDMHWHYRRKLAREWQEVLGAPMEGATTKQAVEAFRPIVEAPDTFEELVAADPVVAVVFNQHLAPLGYKHDEQLLRAIGRVFMYTYSTDAITAQQIGYDPNVPENAYDRNLARVLSEVTSEPKLRPAFNKLVSHLRKRVLIDRYHMEPDFMLDLMQKKDDDPNDVGYGPLDWRHPASHGVYWGALGVKRAIDIYQLDKHIDLVNTDRQVIHSLQELRDTGRMVFDPVTDRLDMLPDPRYIDAYEQAMLAARRRAEQDPNLPSQTVTTFDAGHENFLQLAVAFEYVYGNVEKAEYWRQKAKRLYGPGSQKHKANIQFSGNINDYNKPLEDLVGEWWIENGYFDTGRSFVDGMIAQGFVRGLGQNDPAFYNRHVKLAKQVHDQIKAESVTDARTDQDRMALLPFDAVMTFSFRSLIVDPRNDPLTRHRVWMNAPNAFKLRVYDQVKPIFDKQFAEAKLSVDRLFPAPQGLAEFRKANPAKPTSEKTESIETN